ncbi:hypothetical protein [Microbacterium halotolerans]|uniref:hypothetical protein n=1 Tax=Microbacterium halotolerans TaxID=246613 RepID=UPI000E6AE12A|nr:hypothetical protein [Microbacterium halotolerans]
MDFFLKLLPWILPVVLAIVAISQGSWGIAVGILAVFAVIYGFMSFRGRVAEKAAQDREERLGEGR